MSASDFALMTGRNQTRLRQGRECVRAALSRPFLGESAQGNNIVVVIMRSTESITLSQGDHAIRLDCRRSAHQARQL
jgi:hypothetical protein